MISNEKLENIISECKKVGHDIRIRDISYVLLCRFISDKNVVYRSIFGSVENDTEIELYDQSKSIAFLKAYLKDEEASGSKGRKKKGSDISFDENKEEMIRLIKEAQEALDRGEIEAKDALKIQADLRVKLNDKFAVKDETQEQIVCVSQKFDAICPYCSHEVARRPISKDEAMDMYNLIEKTNSDESN